MAREEIEAKNSIEITSKYNPGDVIKTTQTTRLYLGELYEYAATYTSKYRNRGGVALDLWSARDRYDRLIVIWNKPKKFHWFKRYYGDQYLEEIPLFQTTELLTDRPIGQIYREGALPERYLDKLLLKVISQTFNQKGAFIKSRITDYLMSTLPTYSCEKNLQKLTREQVRKQVQEYSRTISDLDCFILDESELTDEWKRLIKQDLRRE